MNDNEFDLNKLYKELKKLQEQLKAHVKQEHQGVSAPSADCEKCLWFFEEREKHFDLLLEVFKKVGVLLIPAELLPELPKWLTMLGLGSTSELDWSDVFVLESSNGKKRLFRPFDPNEFGINGYYLN